MFGGKFTNLPGSYFKQINLATCVDVCMKMWSGLGWPSMVNCFLCSYPNRGWPSNTPSSLLWNELLDCAALAMIGNIDFKEIQNNFLVDFHQSYLVAPDLHLLEVGSRKITQIQPIPQNNSKCIQLRFVICNLSPLMLDNPPSLNFLDDF